VGVNLPLSFQFARRSAPGIFGTVSGKWPADAPMGITIMEAEKDYYSILGVLPSIDDAALAAVYRALLKKYHPDVFSGSKAEAESRTKEIVEAYEVLGDPNKRQAYDNARRNNGFGNYRQEETTGSHSEVTADWEVVSKYHPETEELRSRLSKLSRSLAFTFQVTVLENKMGSNATAIAQKLENEFFERYFGKNPEIHRFVRSALLEGRTDVAQEVNRAIKVLGTPPDSHAFILIKKVRNTMKYEDTEARLIRRQNWFGYWVFSSIVTLIIIALVTILAVFR
jgi:curved DNA-binding protein CbpA